jgi:hypothetical protein
MMRGTFANVRLRNQLVPGIEGGTTRNLLTGETTPVYDAATAYCAARVGNSRTPQDPAAGSQSSPRRVRPTDRRLAIADRGVDRVFIATVDSTAGQLSLNDPGWVQVREIEGPRHVTPSQPPTMTADTRGAEIAVTPLSPRVRPEAGGGCRFRLPTNRAPWGKCVSEGTQTNTQHAFPLVGDIDLDPPTMSAKGVVSGTVIPKPCASDAWAGVLINDPVSYSVLTRDQVRAPHLLTSSPGTDVATEAHVGGQFRFPARGQLVGSHPAANVTASDAMWRGSIGLGERSIRATGRQGRCQ